MCDCVIRFVNHITSVIPPVSAFQRGAAPKCRLNYIWIENGGRIAVLYGEQRDNPEHVAQQLERGDLPISTVVAVAHGPGDEGARRRRRPEDDGGESRAVQERTVSNGG